MDNSYMYTRDVEHEHPCIFIPELTCRRIRSASFVYSFVVWPLVEELMFQKFIQM